MLWQQTWWVKRCPGFLTDSTTVIMNRREQLLRDSYGTVAEVHKEGVTFVGNAVLTRRTAGA